jgi:hypothetical protein
MAPRPNLSGFKWSYTVRVLYTQLSYFSQYSNYTAGWTVRGCNPGTSKNLFCSPKFPDRPWGPPTLLFSGHGRYFSRVKRQGRQAVHFHGLMKLKMSGGIPLCRQYVFISTIGKISHSLPFRVRIMKADCTLLYSASSGRYYDITISSFPRKQLNSHRAVGLLPYCQLT